MNFGIGCLECYPASRGAHAFLAQTVLELQRWVRRSVYHVLLCLSQGNPRELPMKLSKGLRQDMGWLHPGASALFFLYSFWALSDRSFAFVGYSSVAYLCQGSFISDEGLSRFGTRDLYSLTTDSSLPKRIRSFFCWCSQMVAAYDRPRGQGPTISCDYNASHQRSGCSNLFFLFPLIGRNWYPPFV